MQKTQLQEIAEAVSQKWDVVGCSDSEPPPSNLLSAGVHQGPVYSGSQSSVQAGCFHLKSPAIVSNSMYDQFRTNGFIMFLWYGDLWRFDSGV